MCQNEVEMQTRVRLRSFTVGAAVPFGECGHLHSTSSLPVAERCDTDMKLNRRCGNEI